MKVKPFGALAAFALLAIGIAPALAADPAYHLLKEIPIPGDEGWDYLSVDAVARRLYVTHGSKIVVMALDPKTHNIYVPSAKFEPQAEQVTGTSRQRPKMIPGTFKVLVYGPSEPLAATAASNHQDRLERDDHDSNDDLAAWLHLIISRECRISAK